MALCQTKTSINIIVNIITDSTPGQITGTRQFLVPLNVAILRPLNSRYVSSFLLRYYPVPVKPSKCEQIIFRKHTSDGNAKLPLKSQQLTINNN